MSGMVTQADWDEARFRVAAYLRALRLGDRKQQEQILAAILERAAGKRAQNSSETSHGRGDERTARTFRALVWEHGSSRRARGGHRTGFLFGD